MSFQIHALPMAQFAPLFELSDRELAEIGAARVTADSKPGFPCRVSLVDAEIGERLLLVNFEHQPARSAYRASHAIFVREHAERAVPRVGEIPELFERRLLSVRAFDDQHSMIDADVVDGTQLRASIRTMLTNSAVAYLHLHNAKRGCFVATATRA